MYPCTCLSAATPVRPAQVRCVALPSPLVTNRRAFWGAFLSWQSTASAEALAGLHETLAQHAQHVRPIHGALSDALLDPDAASKLPVDLLILLHQHGWKAERRELTLPLAA